MEEVSEGFRGLSETIWMVLESLEELRKGRRSEGKRVRLTSAGERKREKEAACALSKLERQASAH